MIASVSGMVSRNVVPRPTVLVTSTEPPMDSIRVLTTSMPTPRPETLVTCSAVENPGRKIRLRMSRVVIVASCVWETRPRSSAFAAIFPGSMPAPSSLISRWTWPASW